MAAAEVTLRSPASVTLEDQAERSPDSKPSRKIRPGDRVCVGVGVSAGVAVGSGVPVGVEPGPGVSVGVGAGV